jgi:hypothetical protein
MTRCASTFERGDQHVWTGRAGTREAIGRDGHSLEGMSLRYWLHRVSHLQHSQIINP